jgi:ribosomal protein S18 acetylase RimI-like enzyme
MFASMRRFERRDIEPYAVLIAALSPADVRARFHSAAAPASLGQIREMLFGPHALGGFVITSAGGRLYGVAHAAAGSGGCAEFGIVVAAAFRRRGYGGALTDALLRALPRRGVFAVEAYTLWENYAAGALLSSRGFRGSHEGGGSVHWALALDRALAS